MDIAYYMPFKAMGHPHPSGDLVIGTELHDHLRSQGHRIRATSTLRLRWAHFRPACLLQLAFEKRRLTRQFAIQGPDLWLTYHSYHKAPDLLGASCARSLKIPYAVFQGIYATKYRKRLKTMPGFYLNRWVLRQADHIFTNKKRDLHNLARLIPQERLTYIPPGLHPDDFAFSPICRQQVRDNLHLGPDPVVVTAAMMRPGVKSKGLSQVIDSCAELNRQGLACTLLVIGDGSNRPDLEQKSKQLLKERAVFTGLVPRSQLAEYFSAGDIFAFPGYQESLGMVYLESQACSLPVVALGDWGGSEAVEHGQTGLLSPAQQPPDFTANLAKLVQDEAYRKQLGITAAAHVRSRHDLHRNYRLLEEKLLQLVEQKGRP